jgi:thiamine biosynthesis lipoprotein
VYEADRFATAAFAMGRDGIGFIASLPEMDGYMVEWSGTATFTPGFMRYMA